MDISGKSLSSLSRSCTQSSIYFIDGRRTYDLLTRYDSRGPVNVAHPVCFSGETSRPDSPFRCVGFITFVTSNAATINIFKREF